MGVVEQAAYDVIHQYARSVAGRSEEEALPSPCVPPALDGRVVRINPPAAPAVRLVRALAGQHAAAAAAAAATAGASGGGAGDGGAGGVPSAPDMHSGGRRRERLGSGRSPEASTTPPRSRGKTRDAFDLGLDARTPTGALSPAPGTGRSGGEELGLGDEALAMHVMWEGEAEEEEEEEDGADASKPLSRSEMMQQVISQYGRIAPPGSPLPGSGSGSPGAGRKLGGKRSGRQGKG